ncbi:MAG: zinc ABC transporter substrate-binding protein [Roseovarius sp.]|nr:zinc ABC transporter substrate-binding protein [Roseovarius sp.]
MPITFNRREFIGYALVTQVLGPASAKAATAPLKAVATTGMIADAIGRVGGGLVEVKSLMGPGVDPHSYRQTRSDIVSMTRADMVFWHGLNLEAQMEEFLVRLSRRGGVIAVAETLPGELLIGHPDYQGRYDPHVWMVPDLWKNVVRTVEDALKLRMPGHATEIAENSNLYIGEIDRLGSYVRSILDTVPKTRRVLLTAHDAFGYFGRAYGFDVVGIQGISTESEVGLNRMRMLVEMIVERDVKAVFVETSVSDRNVRALIEGAAARGHEVKLGGELYSDAMGKSGTYEGTYMGMIDHNATTIAGSLGGVVPPHGMNGMLAAAF